jgi:hypothetical protein
VNRHERRRQERQQAKTGRPIAVITDTGFYEATGNEAGQLPPKTLGQHRWVITAAYVATEAQVLGAINDEATYFDHENRLSVAVGCWDCEQPYPVIKPGTHCPSPGDDL